jgi:hypothetical protein
MRLVAAVAELGSLDLMRVLALCSALLLTACGTYTSVIGPYAASVSRTDAQSIVRLAQTIYPGHYNTMTLDAVGRDRVNVDTQKGNGSYGFVAVRRGGTWKVDKAAGSPPPPLD